MAGVVADLPVREAQRGQAGCHVGLVAFSILGLLQSVVVGAEAVGLHDEAQGREVEVDSVSVYLGLRHWLRQVGLAGQGEKTPLEFGLRQTERVAGEDGAQWRDAPSLADRVEVAQQLFGSGAPARVIKVVGRLVTAIPSLRMISCGFKSRRWMLILRCLRLTSDGTVTSMPQLCLS